MIDRGRHNVLGIMVDAVDYEAAVQKIADAGRARQPLAVSALAVHGVMTGVLATTRALTPGSHLASVMGVVGFFGWLGHANGGFLGGYLYDLTGGHEAAYGIAAASAALNLVVVGLLYRRTLRPTGASALA